MTRFQYQVLTTVLIFILVCAGGAFLYFYSQAAEPLREERAKAQEVTEVIRAVGALLVLPEDEDPTVATVTNMEELRGQPFFAQAKLGHKVLIYTQARKAILYDPEINKIVEVAPLSIDSPQ